MISGRLIISYFFLVLHIVVFAQTEDSNFRKYLKAAEKLEDLKEYALAAESYSKAYLLKPQKHLLLYKSAVNYHKAKEYNKACELFESIIEFKSEYFDFSYNYAMSLKSNAKPKLARFFFEDYLKNYTGNNWDFVQKIVDRELAGCELSISYEEADDSPLTAKLSDLNTGKRILFFTYYGDDMILVFEDGTVNGKNKKSNILVENCLKKFKKSELDLVELAFSPDRQRVYISYQNKNKLKQKKQIFQSILIEGSWTNPVALPPYVNFPDANTQSPYVMTHEGRDFIYYSSDRPGGIGGFDIWFTTCKIDEANLFTIPGNLGAGINSEGDELYPFYNHLDSTLYFSSNGYVSVGGQDVYKAMGFKKDWGLVQNLYLPANSYADDDKLMFSPDQEQCYILSDRYSSSTKVNGSEPALFELAKKKYMVTMMGDVVTYTKGRNRNVKGFKLDLFKVLSRNKRALVKSVEIEGGDYLFNNIEGDAVYVIRISKEGYQVNEMPIVASKQSVFTEHVLLKSVPENYSKEELVQMQNTIRSNRIVIGDVRINTPPNSVENKNKIEFGNVKVVENSKDGQKRNDSSVTYDTYKDNPVSTSNNQISIGQVAINSDQNNASMFSSLGVSYIVQVAAVKNYVGKKFFKLLDYGMICKEPVKDLNRILIVPSEVKECNSTGFASLEQATKICDKIRSNTTFESSFVIKYINGSRDKVFR